MNNEKHLRKRRKFVKSFEEFMNRCVYNLCSIMYTRYSIMGYDKGRKLI